MTSSSFKLLGRLWLPLVIVAVIGCGALIVSRVHGIFGSNELPSYSDSVGGGASTSPKKVLYEVFGPAGTVADINYFDMHGSPQQVNGASLPWSVALQTNSPAVIANIVAQGDSDSIGCRIVVDGEVKAERISNEVNAYTHCFAKGA